MRKEPYIAQRAEGEAPYTKLQRRTLEEVQRLSGKVWTDYNAHDPGVTLAEAANHALAELDYKLGFGVKDSLSEQGRPFDGNRFGLFPPVEVYTTSPVTEDDWRRALFAAVSGIGNVRASCNADTGGWIITVTLPPFTHESGKDIIQKVEEAFNARRNLCEWLEKVEIATPDALDFGADMEIEAGADAAEVLANVYWRILRYLSDDITLLTPGSRMAEDFTPGEWLEGSADSLRVILPEQEDTEHELYRKLRDVEGVARFHTCYLTRDGVPRTRLTADCSLRIPKTTEELENITVRKDGKKVSVDIDRFLQRLEGLHLTRSHSVGWRKGNGEKGREWSLPTGTWRDVFRHYPIAADLPDCYRMSPKEEKPSAFEAYTRLYDRLLTNGLEELKGLPGLLSIEEGDGAGIRYDKRGKAELKSRYLDFLDALYGVESNPAWLTEENSYGETPAGTLRRRTGFLRNVARLQRDRARARNVLRSAEDGNTPAVKEWFCRLLGLDPDDGRTVSNVLPKHNLRLLDEDKDGDDRDRPDVLDRLDSLLIGERMLKPENVLPVRFKPLSRDEEGKRKEYAEMRKALPFFNENLITGDLFRGGTRMDSYRIVKANEEETYMLVYRHREGRGWTNLGQADKVETLERLANILRRFLRELNKRSETLYVVEPVLADRERAFEVMLVLPAWTYRFHNPRFREKCVELLSSLVPAHLSGKIYWLGEKEMRKFEQCYHQLMHTFADSRLASYRGDLMRVIDELVGEAEGKMEPDDTD